MDFMILDAMIIVINTIWCAPFHTLLCVWLWQNFLNDLNPVDKMNI